jgi:hypothetical protein
MKEESPIDVIVCKVLNVISLSLVNNMKDTKEERLPSNKEISVEKTIVNTKLETITKENANPKLKRLA